MTLEQEVTWLFKDLSATVVLTASFVEINIFYSFTKAMLYIVRAKLGGLSIEFNRGCGEEIQERAPCHSTGSRERRELSCPPGRGGCDLNILLSPHHPPWCQVQAGWVRESGSCREVGILRRLWSLHPAFHG